MSGANGQIESDGRKDEPTALTGGMRAANILSLLAALVWGLGFVAQVSGSVSLQPFSYNAARNILGALALAPAVLFFDRRKDRPARASILPAFVCGLVLFVAQTLQQYGLALTRSPAKGGFLTSIYTVMVPILEFIIFGKRFAKVLWLSVALSLGGLFLIFLGAGSASQLMSVSLGDCLLLANCVMYAVHIICIDRFIDKIRPLLFSLLQVIVVAALSCAPALLFESFDIASLEQAAVPVLYGGLVSTAIGYTLQVFSQRNGNVVLTSVFFSMESVFAALGGAVILGERLALLTVFGCLLVFASVILAQMPFGRAFG